MKINTSTEARAAGLMSAVPANDSDFAVSAAGACGRPAVAWCPHDVWRTRILPYQSRQRAAAASEGRSQHP